MTGFASILLTNAVEEWGPKAGDAHWIYQAFAKCANAYSAGFFSIFALVGITAAQLFCHRALRIGTTPIVVNGISPTNLSNQFHMTARMRRWLIPPTTLRRDCTIH